MRFDESLTDHQIETLCHQFSRAMLFPDDTILEELGTNRKRLSIQELGNIKKQYRISMQAIVMRALVCNIINENYTKQFFNILKQMGWRVDELIVYEGVEGSNRFD